ncbi:hypothetical protein [Acetobacterium sp.]|uniref:hypothetical protein n=1 Tax=Acetobacterium sp. TaxID=1872094 RepID=UPI000CCA02E6|nr:hypothetical protein [Acetobacterium sp.]MDO9491296.1 hypothetical protein [Acetobacterium sp.]PKM74575.1 MAG: hypothetical protein CVU92_05780 [Firmicutes bacterium HGW-Firmicutes-17]
MKKIQSKIVSFCFILLTLFLSSGCQNLFIPTNVPVVLRYNPVSNNPSPQQISIQSYNMASPGIVQDITKSGNNLILFTFGTTYNIDTYNTETLQLSSFVNSDKKALSALYDTFDTGIYYAQKLIDPITGSVGSQIIWSDVNQNTTRVISLPEENVVQRFGIGNSGQVVYANNNNQIVLANTEGNRQVYTVLNNYNILAIDYIDKEKGIVFIATNPQNEERTNLYYAKIKDDSDELASTLIAENVTSFEINDLTDQVVFIKNNGDSQSIRTWNTSASTSSGLATGNYGSARFTPNGERIVFTQSTPNSDNQAESIWIMDASGKNSLQLTAPLNINSEIICHPYKSVLFFSVEKSSDSIISTDEHTLSQTYQLTYKID